MWLWHAKSKLEKTKQKKTTTCTTRHTKQPTYLSQGEDTLARPGNTSPDHDIVLTHITVVGEATHWGDGLLSWVKFSGSIVLHQLQYTSWQCTFPPPSQTSKTWVDTAFKNRSFKNIWLTIRRKAAWWIQSTHGFQCTLAGVLSTFSSLSVQSFSWTAIKKQQKSCIHT